MASTRDILRRRRAIENISQITKAMEMVAAAKLRRAQDAVLAARPYARRLEEMLQHVAAALASAGSEVEHPLLARPSSGPALYVVFAADRGLAGSFNANVLRRAQHALAGSERAPGQVAVVAVGRKALDYFRHRGIPVVHRYLGLGEEARVEVADAIAQYVMDRFTGGEAREVYLVYNEFLSALSQRPQVRQLLPIAPPAQARAAGGAGTSYIFAPSAETVLAALLPKLVRNGIFQALLESKASEHGARMTAMRAASDNASELIERLTLQYNRARQAAITKEIAEIVGGAEALSR